MNRQDFMNPKLFSGIIGVESAGSFQNLNGFPEYKATFLVPMYQKMFDYNVITTIPTPYYNYEDCTHLGDMLWITTPERTIGEMVYLNTYEEFLYDTLDNYINKYKDISKLKYIAQKYCDINKLNYYLSTVKEYVLNSLENM